MQNKTYVLFGFNKHDEDDTGYFSINLDITSELCMAKRFPSKKRRGQKGFGTPKQWLDFINNDSELNKGFKFHLVPVNFNYL